jgi:hypothetical protein
LLIKIFCYFKNASQNTVAQQSFFVSGVSHKNAIFKELLMCRLRSKHPLPRSPTVQCRGWGRSGSFQPEAVNLVMDVKQRVLGLNHLFIPLFYDLLYSKAQV